MTPPRDVLRVTMTRAAPGGRRRPARRFRFPCGHVDGPRAVNRRLRTTDRAVWVGCRSCNLVTLVVARPRESD